MFQHIKGIAVLVVVILLIGIGSYFFLTRSAQIANKNALQNMPAAGQISDTISTDTKDVVQQPGKGAIVRFALDSSNTEVSFTINEILRGSPFTVVGTTRDINGSIDVDIANPSQSTIGTVTIDARTLRTDNQNRDGAIKSLILHSEDAGKEYITFVPKSISGFPKAFAAGIPFNLIIEGDLIIAGVTHAKTFTATNVTVSSDALTAVARATVKRSDYGLAIPNIPFVANVSDEFTLSIQIKAFAGK